MPTPTLVTDQALARTYDGGAYDDAFEAAQQYRAFVDYRLTNPDQGPTAIANTLEIPVGRARSWSDGRTPYVVDALETARDYGWLALEATDDAFGPLNTLVAAVFSGGSLNGDNWIPTFVLNEQGYNAPAVDALESAGVGVTEHEPETETRAPVVRPERDGAVLGRVLHILGVPIGTKTQLESLSLPPYLESAPEDVRESFVRTYLENRGYEGRSSDCIQIGEHRPATYRRELAALTEAVADAPVDAGETYITISADAARALEVSPRYVGAE